MHDNERIAEALKGFVKIAGDFDKQEFMALTSTMIDIWSDMRGLTSVQTLEMVDEIREVMGQVHELIGAFSEA